MSEYIVMGDGRENDRHIIYCRGSLSQCLKKSRRMIMHWNKDYFHPKKRLEFTKTSDQEFVDRFHNAWLRVPDIIKLPKLKLP